MKWLIALPIILAAACSNAADDPPATVGLSPTPTARTRTQPPRPSFDATQELYNRFLQQARSDIEAGDLALDVQCDPDYQQTVIDQLSGATSAEKAVLQRAMGDACIEAGAYPHLDLDYSPYHDDAPSP